jgi:hypothetical protein
MIISWFIFIHFAIWCHNFKHTKWYIIIHITIMSLITAFTIVAATIMLTLHGLKNFNNSVVH